MGRGFPTHENEQATRDAMPINPEPAYDNTVSAVSVYS